MTTHPDYTLARPVDDTRKRRAEARLFTMAAVDSNLPVFDLDIIPPLFPEVFPSDFLEESGGIDGDYLARLTRGTR